MEANFEHEKGWKEYLFSNNWANIAWFFMGGICGTSFLAWIFWKFHDSNYLLNAPFFTLGLVLLKELLDTITSLIPKLQGRFGFDPAGGDWRDIFLGFLGIVLTLILLSV
jgi:hypothetical protein